MKKLIYSLRSTPKEELIAAVFTTALKLLALYAIGSAALRFGYTLLESPFMFLLVLLNLTPLFAVGMLLFTRNIWIAAAGLLGFLTFFAISLIGTQSWAVEGYASGLGFGFADYSLFKTALLILPALLVQAVRVYRKNNSEVIESVATTKTSSGNFFKGLIFGVYMLALVALVSLNTRNFQSCRWVYMYQAYIWPGLCCPCCSIYPPENYSGLYQRWDYNGKLVEKADYVNGRYHGNRLLIEDGWAISETKWVEGKRHGEEKYWSRGQTESDPTVGIWESGKRKNGKFKYAYNIVTITNSVPWEGKFQQYRTDDSGIRYRDGIAIYSNGVQIGKIEEGSKE